MSVSNPGERGIRLLHCVEWINWHNVVSVSKSWSKNCLYIVAMISRWQSPDRNPGILDPSPALKAVHTLLLTSGGCRGGDSIWKSGHSSDVSSDHYVSEWLVQTYFFSRWHFSHEVRSSFYYEIDLSLNSLSITLGKSLHFSESLPAKFILLKKCYMHQVRSHLKGILLITCERGNMQCSPIFTHPKYNKEIWSEKFIFDSLWYKFRF